MKKLIGLFAVVAIIALGACAGPGGGEGGGCNGCGGYDAAASMIKMYTDGTMKATYLIQVHADAAVGQYWETTTTSDAAPDGTTARWTVVKVDGANVTVEHDSGAGYVLAYEVDTSKSLEDAAKEGNVVNAWIGKNDEAPEAIEIMAVVEPSGCTPEAPESTTEDFSEDIAGGSWTGTKTTTAEYNLVTWIAENGWFNGMVRMTAAGGMKTELSAYGDEGTASLNWDGDACGGGCDPCGGACG